MVQDEQSNRLIHYRKRLRLTQSQVARLLGWKNTKGLCRIESGTVLPTLPTAFKLGSIYRIPVEFLFKDHYEAIRNDIRTREESVMPLGQQPLPLSYSTDRHS